ncbi:MAG: FAD-dependent oxidoreductase [Clostridiales bacterium]|jgi:hypothetical protein|nr:FAD-dependent oxidoreductase [Clostridiales bacterium]
MGAFQTIGHSAEFCVVGGGLAGLCAALAAARRGLSVVLMQDRPMLGGNASSEVRMWVMGAQGRDRQETGIVEELMLENLYRNPYKNYSIWDGIVHEKARMEKNITLLLNCSCLDAETDGGKIRSVTGWQTTTQTFHRVEAPLFADCSGDSVLAPLTGAEHRVGHEARDEFGEDIAPTEADRKTMGLSILLQARETDSPKTFIPPAWAEKYTRESLPHRTPDLGDDGENFWYLELGGARDSIADTERLRDELLAVAYGMWDFVKNDPGNREKYANYDLDWMGFLPGKRESRRYVGDYVMTQADVRAGGRFDDIVAYGGWPMDDHNPDGFRTAEPPTVYHPAPSPFGIAYRCLYSKNIENLLFAGRNISISHVALSSTRVMATCAVLGQAAGTAAAVAAARGASPRGVGEKHIRELQDMLMEDDCWLPGLRRRPPALMARAAIRVRRGGAKAAIAAGGASAVAGSGASAADGAAAARAGAEVAGAAGTDATNGAACGSVLLNGADRPDASGENRLALVPGDSVEFCFPEPVFVERARFVFDSDLNRDTQPEGQLHKRPMFANYYRRAQAACVPKTLPRDFRLVLQTAAGGAGPGGQPACGGDGADAGTAAGMGASAGAAIGTSASASAAAGAGPEKVISVEGNHQRLVYVPINAAVTSVRFELVSTWGSSETGVFSFDLA